MISEILMISILSLLLLQTSVMWMSLALIPFCLMALTSVSNLSANYSLIVLLYSLIFVGGLLVLLVAVSALLSYESTTNLDLWLFPPLVIMFFITNTVLKKDSLMNTSWMKNESSLLMIALVTLTVALMLISWQSNFNKAMSRFM